MDLITPYDVSFHGKLRNLIKEGQIERVKGILPSSSVYCTADESGATLLHYSAQYNNANLTQFLLDRGFNVNAQDSMGTTPLMIAVMEKHISVMRILLAAGADIFKLNNAKKSVLHTLSTQEAENCNIIQSVFWVLQKKCFTSKEVARKLLDAGCHLFQASLLKDAEVIEYMLKAGSPVDFTHSMNKFTAAHGAVIIDDLRSLKLLVEHGADVNALDVKNENTLCKLYKLYKEHSSEKIEILQILLNRGASVTSCTKVGVFQACSILTKGNREAVHMLIESGLDFSVKDVQSKKRVMHYFAYNLNPGVADELKLHVNKFNVNVRDKYGQTPLHISAREGNVSMLKFLLKQGARSDIKTINQNITPLYYPYECTKLGFEEQYYQCGEILLQHDPDPQFAVFDKNRESVTIFDAALKTNDIDRIKPVVAHLAMTEKFGTAITETIWTKINSHNSLKEYFKECQKLLAEQISGGVAVHDLIRSDKMKMAQYLNNKRIVRKLQDKNYKLKMSKYRYYNNILGRLCSKGNRYKKMKNKASEVICKIFQNRIHKKNLIVDKIINYLNDQSLRHLCKLYIQLPLQRVTVSLNDKQS